MGYNYYYSLVSAFFLAAILICVCFKFTEKTLQNFRYIRVAAALFAACLLEVMSSILFTDINADTVNLNMIVTAFYFISVVHSVYFYGLYIDGFIYGGEHIVDKKRWINRILLSIYSLMLVVNHWGHYIFYFDENYIYCHGSLYNVVFIFPFYFILYGTIRMICNRKALTKRQMIPMFTFSVVVVATSVIQFVVIPDILLSLCAGAIGIIIVFFFLETPDFKTLYETMDDLRKAEEIAQEERIKAYAANQAKSSFLANVSHEIRTPINAVLGMNEMIMRETTEDQVREYALDVNAAGMSLLAIINDILDISKIEAGKMEVVPADYELVPLIDDLVNMTSVRAMKKGLDFNLDVDPNLPVKLFGDDIRIKQIIMNLLSNGVKYTKEGSVTLSISGTRNEDVESLTVEVIDTGIGIKEEEKENLFKAFHRLDEKTNRSIEGTGLGMSIANELLNLMGSEIQFESEYEKGSKFYFVLEQKIVDDAPIGDIQDVLKSKAKNYKFVVRFTAPESKILVVDDNSINRKVVAGLLKPIGCEVDEAGGGYECLDKVKEKHYDLIFLDHLMPDLDGVWTLEKLKSEENLCHETPVIAFTANAVSGMKESFLGTGFNGFISKPVDSARLEDILLEFLPKEHIHEGEAVEVANEPEEPLPDLEDFDFRYATVCLGKNTLIKSVASDFYDQADRIRDSLSEFARGLDNPEIMSRYRTDVHALKSTSRMLGEITLSGLAKTSEDAAKASDKEKVLMLHPIIMAELSKAKEELEELIPKKNDVTKKTIDRDMLIVRLQDLKNVVDNRDVKKVDELAGELEAFEYEEAVSSDITNLIELIKMLKMLKASALIDEIINKLEVD